MERLWLANIAPGTTDDEIKDAGEEVRAGPRVLGDPAGGRHGLAARRADDVLQQEVRLAEQALAALERHVLEGTRARLLDNDRLRRDRRPPSAGGAPQCGAEGAAAASFARRSCPGRAGDRHLREVADREAIAGGNPDDAVDFRRIGRAAGDRGLAFVSVDEHGHRGPHALREAPGADLFLHRHEPRPAVFPHLGRNRIGQRIRRGAVDRRVGEAADAVELCRFEKREELAELGFRLARESGDERAADDEVRAHRAPRLDAPQRALRVRGTLHELQDARARVLERHVEIGEEAACRRVGRHPVDHLVDVRIGIDVVEPHPRAVRARQGVERRRELVHPRLERAPLPEARAVAHVDAVGARVLRHDQELAHAGREQPLRFRQHFADGARHEIAAHRRDDAERAPVVAAFADLEVRVVARRELDPLRRHEVRERIVRLRQMRVHRRHHFVRRVRPGDGQHLRVRFADEAAAVFRAEAAGDDHLAVLRERLADGVERFGDGGVDEAAGVDDDEIGARVGPVDRVALGAQLREDHLRIDERLRAAERHEADARRTRSGALCRARTGRRRRPANVQRARVASWTSRSGSAASHCGSPVVQSLIAARCRIAKNSGRARRVVALLPALSAWRRRPACFAAEHRNWGTGTRRRCRASGPASAAACP